MWFQNLNFSSSSYYTRLQNALDLDQQLIETYLGLETPDFATGYEVYSKGYASKSTATFTVSDLTIAIPAESRITGVANDGSTVAGSTTDAVVAGDPSITVEYETADTQENHVRCMVGGSPTPMTDGCFQDGGGSLQVNGQTVTYTAVENTNGRTIQGLSLKVDRHRPANADGSESSTNPYFPDFQKFVDYYGTPEYADKWISAAFLGQNAGLARGNADFSSIGDDGRIEAAKKGSAYMSVGMYVIRELEDAIDDCERGCDTEDCNLDSVHALDEAVAFYTGSLEGKDGSGEGVFFYSLADKRCENFKTCGSEGTEITGTSKVNIEIFRYFDQAKSLLASKQCESAREIKSKIVQKMWIPLVQGTLRYAWILNNEPYEEKGMSEGATFLAGVLPMVAACNGDDAEAIYAQMKMGNSGDVDFPTIKAAFERNYECLGVTCGDVGGLFNTATGEYEIDASPCGRKNSSSSNSDVNVGLAVGLPIGILCGLILSYWLYRRCGSKNSEVEFKSDSNGNNV